MNIHDLELSVRAQNAMKHAGITTVEELINYNWWKFAKQQHMGKKTIAEVCAKVMELTRGRALEQAKKYDETPFYRDRLNNANKKLVMVARLTGAITEAINGSVAT